MTAPISQLKPGEYSTNTALQADLGALSEFDTGMYRLCKTTAAIATAGGFAVVGSKTVGVYNWNITASAGLNDADVLGGIPIASDTFVGYINSTITVPINAFLYIQVYGPGRVAPSNTTIVSPAVFGATTTSGCVASVDSSVYAPGGVKGRITATTAAAVANAPIACFWTA